MTTLAQVGDNGLGLWEEAVTELQPVAVPVLRFAVGFAVVTAVGWYLVEPSVSRGIRRRNRGNPTIQEAISRYLRLLSLVLGVAVGAATAGYDTLLLNSALVIAAATLAVGVAGQAVIGSIVSGVALVSDPEFNVGNYIKWSGGEGVVRSITLRVTRVKTPDGALVTVPNTTLTDESVERPYGGGSYRVIEEIRLAYEEEVDEAIRLLEGVAEEVDGILEKPEPEAYIESLDSDAVMLHVHYRIMKPRSKDIFRVRSEYARIAKRRLEEEDFAVSPASKRELNGRIRVDEG
jgi:small-conductance mechanosensitive channel